MNRLPSFSSDDSHDHSPIQVKESSAAIRERAPLELGSPHRLFFPQHFEPRYQYPLFIWLHSQDSSEYELDEVAPAISTRNYIAVGLRAPLTCPTNPRLFRWSLKTDILPIVEEIVLDAATTAADDHCVNPTKIFIGGYGKGGSVAQWIALRYPEYFAGALSINGEIPDRPKLLVRWKEARRLPVLFMYGEKSELCPSTSVASSLNLAHRSALNYLFSQYNCGDCLDKSMTSMMNHFMMNATVQTR